MRKHTKLAVSSLLLMGGTILAPYNTYASGGRDLTSPESFTDQVINVCVDIDKIWGAQCVDLFSDFHYNYTGRWLSTAGTFIASGLWDDKYYNAGNDYTLIYEFTDIMPGDWVVFAGDPGHVGMAVSGYSNGYIKLLGENQGGGACPDGGAAANIIDISSANFRGAFRPKIYMKTAIEKVIIPDTDNVEIIEELDEDNKEEEPSNSKPLESLQLDILNKTLKIGRRSLL